MNGNLQLQGCVRWFFFGGVGGCNFVLLLFFCFFNLLLNKYTEIQGRNFVTTR